MSKGYQEFKGLEGPKVEKTTREKFLTLEDTRRLLACIEGSKHPKWQRDHCAVYLGFFLALRVSEACRLSRESFRHIHDGEVHIRTSKSIPRMPVTCGNCGRRWRTTAKNIGKKVECSRCGHFIDVKAPVAALDLTPPEKQPPVLEHFVCEYIRHYLEFRMREDQDWLIEGHVGHKLKTRQLEKIFGHYAMRCGLGPRYSFHALRHGRGVHVYERFQDLNMVKGMLRQKSLTSAEIYVHMSPAKQEEYRRKLETDSEGF